VSICIADLLSLQVDLGVRNCYLISRKEVVRVKAACHSILFLMANLTADYALGLLDRYFELQLLGLQSFAKD
jgi:hypothetical protein